MAPSLSLLVGRSVGRSVRLSYVPKRAGSYTSVLLAEHLLRMSGDPGEGEIIQYKVEMDLDDTLSQVSSIMISDDTLSKVILSWD